MLLLWLEHLNTLSTTPTWPPPYCVGLYSNVTSIKRFVLIPVSEITAQLLHMDPLQGALFFLVFLITNVLDCFQNGTQ